MKKQGFTLTEILIAAAILSAFIGGLLSLYSSGSKVGNSAMWLQTTSNQLKNAARQINTSIRKSSYPSLLTFPQKITESEDDSFKLHFLNKQLFAADCTKPTNFLTITESTPAKRSFSNNENQDATLMYHIFSLDKKGDLTYSRYKETVEANEITQSFSKPQIPPSTSQGVYKTVLARNVESVTSSKNDEETTSNKTPIKIIITCTMPNSSTTRSETAVGTPNVEVIAHEGVW